MQILPLKFIREEDKKLIGLNLFNLAKLGHLGLPVVESVIAVPPVESFTKILNKYLKHNLIITDHLNNLKAELLNIQIPPGLKSFDLMHLSSSDPKARINTTKLWNNLLEKWTAEILSRIHRGEKELHKLTPQLVIFSANFSVMGRGFYDEDREHAVIKTDKGTLDFKTSSAIENLIIVGNKKLLLPQVYYWGIEDGKIKIVKVMPFTQSFHEEKKEEDRIVSLQKNESARIRTATKVFLDYRGENLTRLDSDGVILNINKMNTDHINGEIEKLFRFDSKIKIIFYPDYELSFERSLEYAKEFLFFRHKKKIEAQIIMPETFSVDEFLNLKREYASLGIYAKGSLKIWKQFRTVADFLNFEEYLDAGFDGSLIDLDKICQIVCGIESDDFLKNPTTDRLTAMEKFFNEMGLSKIIKSLKPVLLKGKLSQNEELLNFFIRSGIWGISFEGNIVNNFREHISFLEKQTVKKLSGIKVQQ